MELLATIETGLGVMHGTDKIPSDHYALALGQVADLRSEVSASETAPVSAADLMNRVLGLAAAWAIKLDK